jgi:ubiquinone/menaquinone biosynthesis C-methylase UbiE
MLFPSPAKALTEMRRVVKSNGRVAAIVFSALEKNPYHGIVYDAAYRIGNIPLPAAGEPWMYALGRQAALENVYSGAGFLNVSVQTVPIVRRFASASEAIRRMRSGAGDVRQVMNRLSESSREAAWTEVEQQFAHFQGPNGLEIPGEVLIGVGTK